MHKDPQALANDFMRVHTFDSGRSFMTAMPPIRLQNMGQTETKRAGRLGENTFEVLKTLGYSDQKLEELRNRKVIGQL
jgi:crotonobetainyl-CoA:carnitine CoA-transferase CaiB-like acyl-CoA transferase